MFDMRDSITKKKIVLATGNKGKVKEMADVLGDFGFEVIAQTDLGIESPIESPFNFKTAYGCPVLQGFFIFSSNVESLFLLKNPLAILVNFNTLKGLVGVQYAEIIPVNLKQLILT